MMAKMFSSCCKSTGIIHILKGMDFSNARTKRPSCFITICISCLIRKERKDIGRYSKKCYVRLKIVKEISSEVDS